MTAPSGTALGGSPFGELVPCGGGKPVPLRKPQIVIGRQAGCDIVLRFLTVAPRHCVLEWTETGWLARDLGSPNGIQVDGVRCRSKVLAQNSVLWIGDQRYRMTYTHQDR